MIFPVPKKKTTQPKFLFQHLLVTQPNLLYWPETTSQIDDSVYAVIKRPTVALRGAGSIPERNKYLYGLQVVVPGLAVCVCDFSMFVNAPTIQELFLV